MAQQLSTPIALSGTIKRASTGALVAEVPFGPEVWSLKGREITVEGTTARVLDLGSRFKARGYARIYLYLAEPAPVVDEATAVHHTEAEAVLAENAEDAGDYDAVLPSPPSPDRRVARQERNTQRAAVADAIKAQAGASATELTPGARDAALRIARAKGWMKDLDWFELAPGAVLYVVNRDSHYEHWSATATAELVAAVEALR